MYGIQIAQHFLQGHSSKSIKCPWEMDDFWSFFQLVLKL